jgi:hypothetical protein
MCHSMKSLRLTTLLASGLLLASCASEPAGPPPVAHDSGGTRMTVVGKDGWQFNRVLRFGDFSTSPVGPTVTYSHSPFCCNTSRSFSAGPFRQAFEARFSNATSKVAFVQKGAAGQEAQVRSITQSASHDVDWATTWFGFPTAIGGRDEVRTSLEGTVEPVDGERPIWHFAMFQDSTQVDLAKPVGWAVDDAGHRVVVLHMPPPAGLPAIVQKLMHGVGPGFRFEMDGQLVGAVDQLPPANVWMRDDLAPEVRMALAGLSTTLLLQPQGQ